MALAITAAPQIMGLVGPNTADRRRHVRRGGQKGKRLSKNVRRRNTTTGHWWWQPSHAIPRVRECRSAAKAAVIREELEGFEPAEQPSIIGYEDAAQEYERERELDEFYELATPHGLLEQKRATALARSGYFEAQIDDLAADPELGAAAFLICEIERSTFVQLAA